MPSTSDRPCARSGVAAALSFAAIFGSAGITALAHEASATQYVYVGPGQTYTTIQSAVNAWGGPDTVIRVLAGNYREQVKIDSTKSPGVCSHRSITTPARVS